MAKVALITGVGGQDGSYLAELLKSKNYSVYGTVRHKPAQDKAEAIVGVTLAETPHFLDTAKLIQAIKPDELYDLAGPSFVTDSDADPVKAGECIGLSSIAVFDAVAKHSPHTRIYHASSSEIFGRAAESPQAETTTPKPATMYGAAKTYAYYTAEMFRKRGFYVATGIAYNHESPRRPDRFLSRKVSKAAARIKLGLQEEVLLGNLDVRRDWGYAKEYVEAMWLSLQQTEPATYLLCTGNLHSVKDLVAITFAHAGLDWKDYVRVDSTLTRTTDPSRLVGSPQSTKLRLGWEAKTGLKELTEIMFTYDLKMLTGPAVGQLNK